MTFNCLVFLFFSLCFFYMRKGKNMYALCVCKRERASSQCLVLEIACKGAKIAVILASLGRSLADTTWYITLCLFWWQILLGTEMVCLTSVFLRHI